MKLTITIYTYIACYELPRYEKDTSAFCLMAAGGGRCRVIIHVAKGGGLIMLKMMCLRIMIRR